MDKKSFSLSLGAKFFIGAFLFIALLFGGLTQIQKETSMAFTIKAERFSFTTDTSSIISAPMQLYSELKGERVSFSNLQPINFQQGKFFEISPGSRAESISEMNIESSLENEGLNIQFSDRFNSITLNELKIYSDVRVTVEKDGSDISFKFKDTSQTDSIRTLYEGKLSLKDSLEIILKNCNLMDAHNVIKNIGSRSLRIGWLPDESSRNITFKGIPDRSTFTFELESQEEKIDLFANFKIHDIDFSKPLYWESALHEESMILDSSFIRIFDPDREDIRLLKRDDFEAIPNIFTMELITITNDGFWLNFHGQFKSLRIGKRGYLGGNQVFNYLVWYSKNKTLVILGAALIWLIGVFLQALPFQRVPENKIRKLRTSLSQVIFKIRKLEQQIAMKKRNKN